MTKLSPEDLVESITNTWVSGVSTSDAQANLLNFAESVDIRGGNEEKFLYVTPTQRIAEGISTGSESLSVQRYNALTETWELGDLELGHDSVTVGSTKIAQYGHGVALKSPVGRVGRVPIAELDQDGIGSVVSVKVGTVREDAVVQPVFTDSFAGTSLLNHLASFSDSVINTITYKSGTTVPSDAVLLDVYKGWRTQAEIDSDPTVNLVLREHIDASDFGSGLEITVDAAQQIEFDLNEIYTVHAYTVGTPFSILGDATVVNPHIGGTQHVPYISVNRTLQDNIEFESTANFALKTNVLELDNTDAFAPTLDNHPATKLYADKSLLNSEIIVKTSADFGTIDSTKSYFIDGVIDMTGVSVEVPVGGINIIGSTFDVSKLICADNTYDMFTSPVGGSGNVLINNVGLTASGTTSQVFNLVSATGNEAFELTDVNVNNCTKMGILNNYRQGLEIDTFRFGGSPTLELTGVWLGGYRINTSLVRNLDAGMTEPLFKAGAGFAMNSRFLTDINCDLPALAPFADFNISNFPNPSTFQLHGCIISRDGVSDPNDSNILPNTNETDLEASFINNEGVPNTFVGARATVGVSATTVLDQSTWAPVLGTFDTGDLQHFDSPANGQLRHLGSTPREFRVSSSAIIDGTSGDEISIKFSAWDDSASIFVDVPHSEQVRFIQNSQGPNDQATFNIICHAVLDQNDFIRMEVMNATNGNDIDVEVSSFFLVEER